MSNQAVIESRRDYLFWLDQTIFWVTARAEALDSKRGEDQAEWAYTMGKDAANRLSKASDRFNEAVRTGL